MVKRQLWPWLRKEEQVSMADRNRKVVVPVCLKLFQHGDLGVYAAHCSGLGLTGYGSSMEEARESFRRVFSTFIHVSRKLGYLERMLDRIGVDWHWADEYHGKYEDVADRYQVHRGDDFVAVSSTESPMAIAV